MRLPTRPLASVAVLFFLTGMAALIYEVLWLKELGLLFGNTSQAMATTLTAFFLGLAAGSHYWGRKVAAYREPLKLYAGLEAAVAVCAAGYFILLAAYGRLYPWVFDCCGNHAGLFTGVKFALALTVLFPPAFFMGGTLPVLSHFAAPNRDDLGRNTALLYGVNTLGAVAGALLAGFYLPVWLGFKASYGLAMAISLSVAAGAYVLSKPQTGQSQAPIETGGVAIRPLAIIAFMSGLSMLALQVLWGRMFAQVLQNSVYTFALILSVFLVCLALSGFLARRLMAVRFDAGQLLFGALITGGLLVNLGPFVFLAWTDELHYIGSNAGWYPYLLQIAAPAAVIMGPPLLLLGMALPLSIRLAQDHGSSSGMLVGQLVGINTLGAIAGSIIAGFLILEWMGLWAGIRLVAVLYFLTAAYWFSRSTEMTSSYRQPGRSDIQKLFGSDWSQRGGLYLPAIGILLAVSVFDTGKLPLVKVDPVNEEESLLEFWESSAGTVAVIRRGEHLQIKVNNHYTLGGTGSFELEQLTGSLPVALHREPRSVYVLGLGTGITAGGVLKHPIQHLAVTELLNDVVVASDKYFGAYTNGLFYDPRVRVLHEDGRHYLRGAREKFDVMIGDLFVPWEVGTGSLYSLEHFRTVAGRLNEGGLFMQWLPAYQLSQAEFDVIARTFLEVFPYATLWRADFGALRPVLGLLGSKSEQDLFAALSARHHQKLLLHFAGDLVSIRSRFEQARLNTDDRPIIEFSAPVSQRSIKAGRQEWLAGAELIELMEALQPGVSGYMIDVPEPWKQWPQAGFSLQKAQWLRYRGRLKEAEQVMENYRLLRGKQD